MEIRKKRQSPALRLCARSVRQVCLLNERPPSLLANQYFISQPLMSQPQPAPHKHETEVARPVPLALALTTSNSSESDSCSVCVPRSGRKKPQRVLPNPETRHWICQVKAEITRCPSLPPLTDPFANPRTAAFAVPRQTRKPWGTRAWASSRKNARRDRSVRKGSTLQCSQPAVSRADCACSSPKQATQICIPTRYITRAGMNTHLKGLLLLSRHNYLSFFLM